ncbi:MAG: metal ABC transporter solute-binding protein, Zn/Mn family [Limnochordia bacterium]|mgnify:CR=1 FL=1|jgi:zinc transport system substrate-binding protein
MRKGTALCAALMIGLIFLNSAGLKAAEKPISVFVSILPQKYFVERIAGSSVKVSVMVQPGASPETYEPSPRQMAELAEAQIYFRIGVPFEDAWLERIQRSNPRLLMVDTRDGIALKPIDGHHHHGEPDDAPHPDGLMDPHIWLSPALVKQQAKTITEALAALDPGNRGPYEHNYRLFVEDLEAADRQIRSILADVQGRKFMVFHPAWGYFADAYDLVQVPIEIEGKEPNARQLAQVIDLARREGIRTIFVQSQFNMKPAEAVARAIQAQVVQLDPLAEDYLDNLISMAQAIAAGVR